MNIMNTGIYAIRNIHSGKCYIGSACNFKIRLASHLGYLRKNKHPSLKLQRAWSKYGENSFVFEKLLVCSKDDLLFYEQRAIDALNSVKNGYNARLIVNSNAGLVASDATREKMSTSQKLQWNRPGVREKASAAQTGRKMPPDAIEKTRQAHLGAKRSPESRARISAAQKGKVISPETRAKISAAGKGRTYTPETIANMSAAAKLRGISQETRVKITDALRGKPRSPEAVAKGVATQAANRAAKLAQSQQESAAC